MQLKLVLATLFASMVLAVPVVDQPKIYGRSKGPIPGSGPSCCSSVPGVCQASCCPIGCPQ
ncbi:hypothetical protein CDEST_15472 [Colletotrichum destructivum]|uniref:Uncharacterized protein n=1 Tax=Colletotrichum destructivum TaxID=34406 RepID=A0AAX4J505_9PEZI|nr:hypothetical protein CDEST_15404 [Colletotrichum destructivum]WQF90458.1 hypothetical protein CDEST_15472 [Colletotrichum destructivum]